MPRVDQTHVLNQENRRLIGIITTVRVTNLARTLGIIGFQELGARSSNVLYLVVSGAPAPEGIPALVQLLQATTWQVAVFSTPFGTRFVDSGELERLTGQPVRSEYRMPGTGSSLPPADVVLACPLTFNSVNKFAHGHADNFAVSLLCEMTGYGVPVVVVPHCKPQLANHPAFTESLATLRGMGVRVLFDPDAPYERRMPPWSEVVAAIPISTRRG